MELILEGHLREDDTVLATVESLCCMILLDHFSCSCPIIFVRSHRKPFVAFPIPEGALYFDHVDLPTRLPTVRLEDGRLTIAGLAAVLRQICRLAGDQGKELMGFRGGCLNAPSEASPWTRFCEVDIVKAASKNLEDQLDRLESHLKTPPRVHNRGSRPGWDNPDLRFLEGPSCVLADLIVAVCIYIGLKSSTLNDYPLVSSWFERVRNLLSLEKQLQKIIILENQTKLSRENSIEKASGDGESLSLYRKTREGRRNTFTNPTLVEELLAIVEGTENIEIAGSKTPYGWEPGWVEPPAVPEERQARKRQQVESVARAIVSAANPGDTVVDFCAGSGHVGLAVAALAPELSVILVDNKEASVARAAEAAAPLPNVKLVQANLATFTAPFQLGCALHACGVATDLVLKKCISQRAACVLSPCCYGAIRSNHEVKYPLSSAYREAGLTEEGLICLGHCADTENSVLGARSMLAVDTDRCLALKENGYEVVLSKLDPPECSSKNNLIIAVRSINNLIE